MNTLIIGGCRSGKSARALAEAAASGAANRLFIATCEPYDAEMRARVERHQRERDAGWHTREVPLDLPQALVDDNDARNVLVVDCLTLWVTNLLMADSSDETIEAAVAALTANLAAMTCPVILVANEVGQGIVPENALARRFRDWAGLVNQRVAAGVDRVLWMVAGIPVKIK
jgi:adenosylcobinamide kinase/adenosylcobinamide-phosphate guanylyltransferase